MVGEPVGFFVGEEVGSLTGLNVGVSVGFLEGSPEGELVGSRVGEAVGDREGGLLPLAPQAAPDDSSRFMVQSVPDTFVFVVLTRASSRTH